MQITISHSYKKEKDAKNFESNFFSLYWFWFIPVMVYVADYDHNQAH